MPRLRHTVEQILAKLREAEVALSKGQPAAQTCRTLGITEQTYSRWHNEYGGRPLHRLHTYRRIAVKNCTRLVLCLGLVPSGQQRV
jgi:putative transposase